MIDDDDFVDFQLASTTTGRNVALVVVTLYSLQITLNLHGLAVDFQEKGIGFSVFFSTFFSLFYSISRLGCFLYSPRRKRGKQSMRRICWDDDDDLGGLLSHTIFPNVHEQNDHRSKQASNPARK